MGAQGGPDTQPGSCGDRTSGAPELPRVEGVVLAGVHAWGECVLESITCRPLFPVAGWPLISHTLAWLREGGVGKINICANSDTGALRKCLGGGEALNVNLHYYEDKMPRGPAGCTRDAVASSSMDAFLVVEGTLVPEVDIAELLEAHRASGSILTVVVSESDRVPRDASTACRPDRLEPTGIYVFSRDALAHVSSAGYQDIKESLIPRLHAQGLRVGTYLVRAAANPRVTNAASYMAVSKWAIERLAARHEAPEGYVRLEGALIHESARLDGQARFIGPVLIGPHCRIEEDALIVGPTCVGEGCTIGRDAVVSRSVLWDHCQVGAKATLDHCILTNGARVLPEAVVRETVCLARSERRGLRETIRSFFRRSAEPKRSVSYVPAAGPSLPLAKSRSANVRTDARRSGVSGNPIIRK